MQSLRLSHQQLQEIISTVQDVYPHEACGMIAGHGHDVVRIVPMTNIAKNPERYYQIDPSEQLKLLKDFDATQQEWIGVFHSHPDGKPHPSMDDIREASLNTPDLIHLIVGLKQSHPALQAWHIHDGQVDPVELVIGQQQISTETSSSRLEIWAVLFSIGIGVVMLLAMSFTLLPAAPPIPTP